MGCIINYHERYLGSYPNSRRVLYRNIKENSPTDIGEWVIRSICFAHRVNKKFIEYTACPESVKMEDLFLLVDSFNYCENYTYTVDKITKVPFEKS